MMVGRQRTDAHLTNEQLEAAALERRYRLPARASAHVHECPRCRREVQELLDLHAALRELKDERPAVGFADRVMARVRLPEPVSWWTRLRCFVRGHRLAVAGATGGGVAAALGALLIRVQYPEVSPAAIAIVILDRSLALAWRGILVVARFAYEAAMASGLIETFGQLTPAGGALLLATLSLVGMGALRILLKLVGDEGAGCGSPARRRSPGRRQ